MTAPAPIEQESATGDNDMWHVACWCNDYMSYCGETGLVDEKMVDDDEVDCIVCADLMNYPCKLCGLYTDQAYYVYRAGG